MRIVPVAVFSLIAALAVSPGTASAQYYGPAANPPTPQQLNTPPSRGTYTQPFGTDPGAAAPYGARGNLNANGYNPGNVVSPYGQPPATSNGYSLGAPPAKNPIP